ncbi:major facilitator superfamily domain-containing protein [Pavlovales sp. CCMP2436]|nr:major facilitator superfamily domain-containing protein [Pavlovales sp. CCMP2436]|mmetsp:Transcript_16909/g.43239  ORF Transcript_16909/g.43239 Transcript_16909/m.43239 type:complete len:555 (+) Transcript_16909:139-1803(+)
MGGMTARRGVGGTQKMVALICINVSNCVCHSVYSVLASFFPQAAAKKGLTAEPVGLIFAVFAAIVFFTAPCVATALSRHGKRNVYLAGLATVCVSTIAFGFVDHIQNADVYFMYCVLFRCVQGFGAALEETAAYALIADIDPEAVSFNLGMTEISTGLGYMVGPTVGGFLFSLGGFALPFVCIGVALLPAMLLISRVVRKDSAHGGGSWGVAPAEGAALSRAHEGEGEEGGEEEVSIPIWTLLARPQILAAVLTATLGNVDYAFLEPTLATHVESLTASPAMIGLLFSAISLTYTISAPVVGWLSHRQRLGPRSLIVWGLAIGSLAFLLVGPSPLLLPLEFQPGPEEGGTLSLPLLCLALVLFGLGEGMCMTPLMEDMMLSSSDLEGSAVNGLSALMTASFSLGQMLGPLLGAFLAPRLGFPWSATGVSAALGLLSLLLAYLQRLSPQHMASGYTLASLCPGGRDAERQGRLHSEPLTGSGAELTALHGAERKSQHLPQDMAMSPVSDSAPEWNSEHFTGRDSRADSLTDSSTSLVEKSGGTRQVVTAKWTAIS